jgi:WD40 repeat protein
MFTAGEDDTVRQWSAGGEEILFEAGEGEVTSLSFGPDGTKLASAAGESTRVFDLSTEELAVDKSTPGAAAVAFSPDGETILSVSAEGTFLLDAADGEVVHSLAAFGIVGGPGSSAAAFSADGRLVLAAFESAGNQVALFETESGQVYRGGFFNVLTAALSSDGAWVAGFYPGRYSVYDTAIPFGVPVHNLSLGQTDGRPVDVQFSLDGTQLISGDHDNVVRIRDIDSREVVLEMRGHSAAIRQVRVSTDGRYVLTAGDDGGARLWSLDTGALLRYFPGHDSRIVTAIAISPDGKFVAIGSADGSVVVTTTALDELVAQVCERLRRDLSDEEKAAYGIQSTGVVCP